jgi:hypothetical protein
MAVTRHELRGVFAVGTDAAAQEDDRHALGTSAASCVLAKNLLVGEGETAATVGADCAFDWSKQGYSR